MRHAGSNPFPVPDDFLDRVHTMTERELGAFYGVCRQVIGKWKKLAGAPRVRIPWTPDQDAYLRAEYGRKTQAEIAAYLGRTSMSVKRRVADLRLMSPRARGWNFSLANKAFNSAARHLVDMRPGSHAEAAADFIRAHDRTCVFRVDSTGKPNPKASFWKYGHGSLVLSEAELLAKAERKGWSSDRWRELAA